MHRKLSVTLILAALLCALAPAAIAQKFPDKPIELVVPWPAGGRTDLTARLTAQFLSETLGQPVVVQNFTGASGVRGAKRVTAAKPDGYTLGMFSSGVVATQYTVSAPTDLKDYDAIGLINMDAGVVAVPASSPAKDLKDFVAQARANPGKFRLGSAPGTSAALMAAIFAKEAKIDLLAVPFGGGGARSVALAGEHIDVDVDVVAIYKSLVEGGKVRLLGLGAEKRSPLLPELPTFREQGTDVVIGTWHGLFAPKGAPKEVLATLETALAKVAADPKFVEMMHKALLETRYMNSAEFAQFLAKEDAAIKRIVQELGLQAPPQ